MLTKNVRRWVALAAVGVLATGCTWAQVGFDAGNTRHNSIEGAFANAIDAGNVAGLTHAWSAFAGFDPQNNAVSGAVVGGGNAYVTSRGSLARLTAVDADDGTFLWWADLGTLLSAPPPAPALAGNRVIAVVEGGIAAFDAAGVVNCNTSATPHPCQPLWRVNTLQIDGASVAFDNSSTPTVSGDVVYVSTAGMNVVALRVNDGAQLWVGNAGSFNSGWPVVANGKVFIGHTAPRRLVGYDVDAQEGCAEDSGAVKCVPIWAADVGVHTTAAPSLVYGRVYAASGEVFDANGVERCSGSAPVTCTPLWWSRSGVQATSLSSQAVGAGKQFVVQPFHQTDVRVFQFDANGVAQCGGWLKTCQPVREYMVGATLAEAPPTTANGVLYVLTTNSVLAFDAEGVSGCSPTLPKPTCQPLWQTITVGTPTWPTVYGGSLYVAFNGELHAYRLPAN